MRKRFLVRPAAAMMMLGMVAACGGGDAEDTQTASTPSTVPAAPADEAAPPADLVAQGQEIYNGAGICMTCHGTGGVGTALAPSLTDDNWLWIDPSQPIQPQIATIVREGVPNPKEHPAPMLPMGGVSLSDDQIEAVSAYVASL